MVHLLRAGEFGITILCVFTKKIFSFIFPYQEFDGVSVEYTTLPGWKTSIAKCTKFENLPENAKLYVKTIEEHLQIPGKN